MTAHTMLLSLAVVEGIHLAELIDQFTEVLTDSGSGSDPAIERLTPIAYPEDADASADFAHATREDLLDRRRTDAATMRHALAPLLVTAPGDLADHEGIEEREIAIRPEDLDAWLRTLTSLRLVIATRLDITADDDDHDPEDSRYGVYDWLGYRLDQLIAIADDYDATNP